MGIDVSLPKSLYRKKRRFFDYNMMIVDHGETLTHTNYQRSWYTISVIFMLKVHVHVLFLRQTS